MTREEEHDYQEAFRRIKEATENKNVELDLSGLSHLTRVPPELVCTHLASMARPHRVRSAQRWLARIPRAKLVQARSGCAHGVKMRDPLLEALHSLLIGQRPEIKSTKPISGVHATVRSSGAVNSPTCLRQRPGRLKTSRPTHPNKVKRPNLCSRSL
jgi:hypothetical protein